MRTLRLNQKGFEPIAVIVIVLVIAVLGFAGYKVMNMNKSAESAQPATSQTAEPEAIKSEADLTNTSKALDESGSELDASLDDSALDADVNALL